MKFSDAINIAFDLRKAAKRYAPKIVFDFIEGGVEDLKTDRESSGASKPGMYRGANNQKPSRTVRNFVRQGNFNGRPKPYITLPLGMYRIHRAPG